MESVDGDIAESVLDLIGRTPLVRLARVGPSSGAAVVGKLEVKNPGGSVKDRPAFAMVRAAEDAGELSRSTRCNPAVLYFKHSWTAGIILDRTKAAGPVTDLSANFVYSMFLLFTIPAANLVSIKWLGVRASGTSTCKVPD